MATVTGFTADRMLEIEDTTVVDGEVVGDNLILYQRDGTPIDAGDVRGPTGATGGGGWVYPRTFASPLYVWDFPHNQGTKAVSVITWDNTGTEIQGEISYPDNDTIRVTFYYPQTGSGEAWN